MIENKLKKYDKLYKHYDYNKDGAITEELSRAFIQFAREGYRHIYHYRMHLTKLQEIIRRKSDIQYLYKYSELCLKIKLLKNVMILCHKLCCHYKAYDIIEVLKSTRDAYNIGKSERQLFRQKKDFYKYIAYNLTEMGYTFSDISGLIDMLVNINKKGQSKWTIKQ